MPGETIAGDGEVSLRRMRGNEDDYRRMARWLSDPRVLQWYEGRDRPQDERSVAEKWGPRALGEGRIEAWFIVFRGDPVGYLQCYPVARAADYDLGDAAGAWGIDLFIGEPGLWDRGIGSRALQAVLAYLFEERRAGRVVIDPQLTNRRAIRAYEKAGFRRVKVLAGHELHEGAWRDCLLMDRWRDDATL